MAGLNPSHRQRLASRLARWARIASASTITCGLAVCCGWIFRVAPLRQLYPGLAAMKLNTAIAIVVLGVALRFALAGPTRATIARALGLTAATIAAATVLEYALGVDLGIDELIVPDPDALVAPGRMSPAIATALVLLGIAVLWIESRWAEWLALLAALIAHLAMLGYLYGVRDLYAIGPFAWVALDTAIAVYALALGVLLARPRRGLMRVVTNDSPGGVMARRLLPAAVVLPAVLALMRQWGEHAGLYGTGLGRAMLVASSSVLFVTLIWWTAAAVTRSDRERRTAEAVVREREAHLATTLDSIGEAVIATNEVGRVARMNPIAERLTGWTTADALGRPLPEVFHIVDEGTGAPVENPVDRVLRDGLVVGLANHTVLIARDGTRRAIADRGAPIRDPKGATRGVVMVFHDQTEARAAERRVRDSEAHKAAILDAALDAIVSIDGSGTILEFNAAAESMFGRSRAEVIGVALTDAIIPPAMRELDRGGLARSLGSRTPSVVGKRVELTAVRRDGSEFPVEASIVRVGRSEPATYTGFIRDVSEARRARAELDRSSDRLRVLAKVSDAFAVVATSYQALLEQIARTIAELVGDGCQVTLLSDDGQQLMNAANAHRDPALERDYRAYFRGMAISKATSPSISATVARSGVSRRADVLPDAIVAQSEDVLKPLVARLNVHSFAVVPIRAHQMVIGTLSLMRSTPDHGYTDEDLTLLQDLADRAGLAIDNARLYAQLEQRVRDRTKELEIANKELESFSYSVAHDLRGPLRAMSGFSRTVLDDYVDRLEPAAVDYLTRIDAAAQRMGLLIDDLLDLARVSRVEVRRTRVDVTEMATAVIEKLRASDPDRDIEIVVARDLAAQGDHRLLEILLTNLLGNAWKFTTRTAHPRIELATSDEHPLTYVVRDNGAGFNPAYSNKLFGVFERLHASSEFEGSGIGLAIAQRIVDRHGGRIWAEGAVGRGAAFYFTLEPPGARSKLVHSVDEYASPTG